MTQVRLAITEMLLETSDWISSPAELGHATETLKHLTSKHDEMIPKTMVNFKFVIFGKSESKI